MSQKLEGTRKGQRKGNTLALPLRLLWEPVGGSDGHRIGLEVLYRIGGWAWEPLIYGKGWHPPRQPLFVGQACRRPVCLHKVDIGLCSPEEGIPSHRLSTARVEPYLRAVKIRQSQVIPAEPLSGYLWLGALLGNDDLHTGEAYNFGPKADVIQPVIILVKTFEKYWDKAKWQIKSDDSLKKESNLLKLCCDKAMSMLNWKAILTFEETIEFTALWYKKYYEEKMNMREFSIQQIQEYCALAKDRGLLWAKNR